MDPPELFQEGLDIRAAIFTRSEYLFIFVGDLSKNDQPTTDEEVGGTDESPKQEVSPEESGVPVQAAQSSTTVEQVQGEPQNSGDDKKTSEVQEIGTLGKQQLDKHEKQENDSSNEQQDSEAHKQDQQDSPVTATDELQENIVPRQDQQNISPDEEQHETAAPTEAEQSVETAVEKQEQDILTPAQQQQENMAGIEQQEAVAPTQNQQEDTARNEQQETLAATQDQLEKEQKEISSTAEDQQGDAAGNKQQETVTVASLQDQQESPVVNEQQEMVAPLQDQQEGPAVNEQQETVAPPQDQQESPVVNEQQETVAPPQDQQETPAVNEQQETIAPPQFQQAQIPVDNNEQVMSAPTKHQPEEGEVNGEVTNEILLNETSLGSESVLASSGTAKEAQELGDEPNLHKSKEDTPKVEIAEEGLQVSQAVVAPAGEIQEENKKLKQEIFMMRQQEDAYRIKVLSLEQEVGKLRARKMDNRSQGEYLALVVLIMLQGRALNLQAASVKKGSPCNCTHIT